MPRPRKNPDEVLKREIRITPPDGQPITDWQLDPSITLLVAFEEGGDDGKRLHYHALIETTMTSQALPKWIYRVARCTTQKGNAVFFTREAHSGTQGYISKHRKVSVRHGTDQTTLEEWFKESDTYVRQRETERKRGQRTREDEMKQVIELVETDITDNQIQAYPNELIGAILKHCHKLNYKFPAKTQMEALVIKLMYTNDNQERCISYYVRSFPPEFFSR